MDSEILLYDLETGKNVALLDGNWITAMRTGVVTAHSVKLFAVENFRKIGIIGLGNTARAVLKILLAIYPGRALNVKLKSYKAQQELFAADFADCQNISFEYCDSYEETIRDSDVVLSAATVLEQDVCADDTNHVKGFRYFKQYKCFAEVSEVVTGKKPGRKR